MIFISIITLNLKAQGEGPITVTKWKGYKVYVQNFHYHFRNEIKLVLKSNPESAKELRIMKTMDIVGATLLVVPPLTLYCINAVLLYSDDIGNFGDYYLSNFALFYKVCIGLDLIAIPITILAGKHFKKAIKVYNQTYETGNAVNAILYLGVVENGIGVQLRF
jgi:hypothetical protein